MTSKGNDIDSIIATLKNFNTITEQEVKFITDKAMEIFANETNTQYVKAPVTVCGDVHGQLHDLI